MQRFRPTFSLPKHADPENVLDIPQTVKMNLNGSEHQKNVDETTFLRPELTHHNFGVLMGRFTS